MAASSPDENYNVVSSAGEYVVRNVSLDLAGREAARLDAEATAPYAERGGEPTGLYKGELVTHYIMGPDGPIGDDTL